MGIETIATIGLGLAAIGGGVSYEQSRKASSQTQDRYIQETQFRDKQVAKSEAAAQRKYEADMRSYKEAVDIYKSNLEYLNNLIADPTSHPDYAGLKASLDKQLSGAKTSLKQSLQKRGRTGGIQDEVLEDLTREYESQLTTISSDIQAKARQQKLALQKPIEPYLGQGQTDWGTYMQPVQAQPFTADMSGFGSSLALLADAEKKKTTTDSTLMKSGESLTPYYQGFDIQDIMDWANTEW